MTALVVDRADLDAFNDTVFIRSESADRLIAVAQERTAALTAAAQASTSLQTVQSGASARGLRASSWGGALRWPPASAIARSATWCATNSVKS